MLTTACVRAVRSLTLLAAVATSLVGCDGGGGDKRPAAQRREERQTEFESAPPIEHLDIPSSRGVGGMGAPPPPPGRPEGKDIYGVDGDRLYFLNAYRGLMVFDITNVDDPKLLGQSPAYGAPVEMVVRNGFATMVVGDFYGNAPDGTPFHGSVVRTIDARNPAAMKVEGDVQVKGSPRDTRVAGDNLVVVSDDFVAPVDPWSSVDGPVGTSNVIVSSVSFGDHAPRLNGTREVDGSSGVFHVTPNAVLVARDVLADAAQRSDPRFTYVRSDMEGATRRTGKSAIDYIAISSIDGSITPRGSLQVDGVLNRWIADVGKWIDLEDDTASIFTCASGPYGDCTGDRYTLTTVDFSNPSAPKQLGTIDIPLKGRGPAARFSNKRMYLAPHDATWSADGEQTSVEVYDLTNPAAPVLAGSTKVSGTVWRFEPVGTDRLFVLGKETGTSRFASRAALRWLDVSNPAQPTVLGTSSFGEGWASALASETFKAFARDDGRKLVALPFSGWSSSREYLNGVQLIEYDTGAVTARGSARAKGRIQHGVFVKDRLVSLSDESLNVIDFADRDHPRVVRELTLARNIVSAQSDGATIAQLSTDWWRFDQPRSELRVLPVANAEEKMLDPNAPTVSIDGTDPQVFRNGDLAYVVTTLYPKPGSLSSHLTPHVQVVDLSNGKATLKGALDLPQDPDGSNTPRWGGCYYWDWYDTSNIVQVGGSALAFRRTRGSYNQRTSRVEQDQKVYVVDLSDPDSPHIALAVVTPDVETWWGNLRVVGNTLYASHYEYAVKPLDSPPYSSEPKDRNRVRYYLDRIDLTDRANPTVGQRINVPGLLVGASDSDPSLLHFVDYRWDGDYAPAQKNELAIARIVGDKAYLESTTPLEGWVGNVFVRGTKAYMSAQEYPRPSEGGAGTSSVKPFEGTSPVKLLEVDLSDPKHPVARASAPAEGWGWLVAVEGDRAIVTSRWGEVGLDIYALRPGEAPSYVQFARTRGWWPNGIARHGGDLYLSTGYWGVQKIAIE